MKKIFLFFSLAFVLLSCQKNGTATAEYPMFWTWMEDREGLDLDTLFVQMDEAGIDGLMLYVPDMERYQKAAALAKEHGVTLYAWIWTLNPRGDRKRLLEEHPEWFDVNREGKSLSETKAYVNSYKFLSAALPEVRDYVVENVRRVCEVDGIDGICLDYCRIVDCVLPISLSYNYNLRQDTEVFPEYDYGYHPAAVEAFMAEYGYDPRSVEDPTRDEKWCAFRERLISEVANLAAETAHSYGKKVCASPFATVKLASFMVAQNFAQWNLDLVFPMVYSDFYSMEPGFTYDATVQNKRDKNPKTTLFCGLGAELGGDFDSLVENMDAAFRGGAQGISLYTIAGLNTPDIRSQFKAYADSLRQIRKANKGTMPALEPVPYAPAGDISLDPLSHPRLMQVVERNIQRLIAGEPIHEKGMNGMVPDDPTRLYPELVLGEYELQRSTDRLLVYEVEEKASGKRLSVLFPIYGGLISGWDVRLAE
ncbi:MAG: hypothetical protein J5871_06045 [Bacteroidales bacterium]|nr:hypothetical protein [Bacteroidales bacterium]